MTDISGSASDLNVSMRAYLSRFSGHRRDEWPDAWAIVKVSPSRWMATLPLRELVHVARDRRTDLRLGGVPHGWQAGDLVLDLGPARVRGTAADWRWLLRRLVAVAGSTEGLYETPGARPWSGGSLELPVGEVAVTDDEAGGWEPTPGAAVRVLSEHTGFSPLEFMDLFGAVWRADGDQGRDLDPTPWGTYLWGEPPQVAATVDDALLTLGLPVGTWLGPGTLGYGVKDPVPVDPWTPTGAVHELVRRLRTRRRRAFTWCRYCGDQIAPEARYSRDVCYGCATMQYGVVY